MRIYFGVARRIEHSDLLRFNREREILVRITSDTIAARHFQLNITSMQTSQGISHVSLGSSASFKAPEHVILKHYQ